MPSESTAGDRRLGTQIAATGSAGLAACITAAAITAESVQGEGAALAGVARATMVAVPIAVGLYAWHQRPADPFGRLLVAVGFGWFLTTLAESGDELLYSVGRVAGWLVEIALIWVLLAFPSGRLNTRVDRALVWTAVGVLALLYLPTALLVDAYPVPSAYMSCDAGCPGNAFQIASEPAVVGDVIVPLRETATVLLFVAVTARLLQRMRGATPILRLTLAPVLPVAAARLVLLALALAVRRADVAAPVLDGLLWAVALGVPALAGAFLLGMFRRRLYAADALQRLGVKASGRLTGEQLQDVVSEAVGDPGLQLVYPADGHWAGVDGQSVAAPEPGSGKCLTRVRDGGRLVAGVVHDEALRDETDYVQGVAAYALTVRENRRLAARLESSLAGGARVADAHPRQRRPRAAADRARPSRRRPAAARRPGHPAGADGGAHQSRPRPRGRAAARPRRRGRQDARGDPGPGARRLPLAARRPGPCRGIASRRAAAADDRDSQPGRGGALPG